MTATTYDSLKTDVRRYLERGSTLASDAIVFEQIPRLISLAELRAAKELKVQGFINPVTSTLQAGVAVYAKPNRWRETVSMNFGAGETNNNRKPIFPRSYEYCRSYWPNADETGEPEFYADYDYNHWLIVPTPDADYPWETLYWQQVPPLSDVNQTNWLTEYASDLLLYATLLEATPFLKNDERIGTWQQMYDRAASTLNGQDMAKILDRAIVRQEA